MDSQELQRLARIGAAARLAELEQERATLLRAFPNLRTAVAASREGQRAVTPPRRRRRSRMSAEARKAVSQRMKLYWAARRAKTPGRKKGGRGSAAAAKT